MRPDDTTRVGRATEDCGELELLYRTAPIGLGLVDCGLRYVHVNDQLAAMNGMPAEEHIGRTLHEVIPDIAALVEPIYRKVIETGEPIVDFELEGTSATEPGVVKCWSASYYPYTFADGTVAGVRTVIQDITARKQAERALRESERELRRMADTLPSMIAYIDRDGRYQFNNAAYEEFFNIPPNTLKGRHVKDVIGEELFEGARQGIETVLAGQKAVFEEEMDIPGRGQRRFQVNLIPHRDEEGKIPGYYVLAQDVTESVQVQEALQRSETRLRLLVETTEVIPWEAAAGTFDFTYVGPQGAEALGYPIEDWYRPGFWEEHIHPDDRDRSFEYCRHAMETRDSYEFEYRMIRKDGTLIWLHDLVTVDRKDGKPVALRGFLIDITARKRAEEISLDRLRFEELISGISAAILTRPTAEVGAAIEDGLQKLTEFFGVDFAALGEFSKDRTKLQAVHSYSVDGPVLMPITLYDSMPWVSEKLRRGEIVMTSRLADLPPEAAVDRQFAEKMGHRATLILPLLINDKPVGGLGLASFHDEMQWPEALIPRLRLVGEIFANGLDRKRQRMEIEELKAKLEREVMYLREEIMVQGHHDEIIGKSDAIQAVLAQVEQVAGTDSSVLIQGETGTGKELIAHAIHNLSGRKDRAMVNVNCAGLPPTLIESELFGRERGAYTGADSRAPGSRWPTTPPSSSTRSPSCRSSFRRSSCACSRTASSSGSAARRQCASTCAWSPRPTATSTRRSPAASSARTCSIG